MMVWKNVMLFLLILAVMLSAIAIVYSKHTHRQLYFELQKLQENRGKLEVEWGQLQLEQGTRSAYSEVEKIARNKLNMVPISAELVVFIKP